MANIILEYHWLVVNRLPLALPGSETKIELNPNRLDSNLERAAQRSAAAQQHSSTAQDGHNNSVQSNPVAVTVWLAKAFSLLILSCFKASWNKRPVLPGQLASQSVTQSLSQLKFYAIDLSLG